MSRYVLAWLLLLTTLTLSAQPDRIPPVAVPSDTVSGGILSADTLIVDTIPADTIPADTTAADSAITRAVEAGVVPMVVSAVPTAAKESFFKRLFHKRMRKLKENYNIDSIRSIKDVDSIMALRYQKTGTYDTLYLARPRQRFTARLRMNVSGSGINTNGHYKELPFDSHLNTPNRITTSIGLAYRGIGLSISVNRRERATPRSSISTTMLTGMASRCPTKPARTMQVGSRLMVREESSLPDCWNQKS